MSVERKHQTGFCRVCGRDVCLRKGDQKVFRHPDSYTSREICKGSGEYPSMIVTEDGDVTKFIPIVVCEKPMKVTVEPDEYIDDWRHRRKSNSFEVALEEPDILGREYPVYTESGTVIGRARIEIGKIVILGPKWAQRTA